MALQLPQSLLTQVSNFGQQPMQNLQQGLLTPVQIAAQQPAGIGAIVSGLGGMFGIDTRSPAQLEQAQRQQQKEYVAGNLSTLGEQGTEIQRQVDLGLLTPAQAQQRVEAVKTTQVAAERKTQKESLELALQEALANNSSVETVTEFEKKLLALGATSEEIRSAKTAGRSARNESETALASSLRQQLIEAVNNGDTEAVGRVAKTASDRLPTFEFQKELQAARKLKVDMAQLTTNERNTEFDQDVYNTLETQIGENAANAYKAKPDNSKAYESLQKQADLIAKEGEDAKALIKDNTVFRDVLNSNIRSAVGTKAFTPDELKKIETAVADGFDGLYSMAKNTMTVAEVNKIVGTVLSDPEIAAAIKEGKTKIDRPGPFTGDDSLSSRINTKLRELPGITSAQPTTEQETKFTPEQDAKFRKLNEELARGKAQKGK
jgi:hypothetical protein